MNRLLKALGVLAIVAAAATVHGGPTGRAHALRLGESSYVTGMNIEDFVSLRKARTGDFLWFRRDGKSYVVTDPAVLEAARAALLPVDELGRELQAVSDRLAPYEKTEAEIDREEERIDAAEEALDERDDADAQAERRQLDGRRRELEARRRTLESQMREVEGDERRLEARERDLDRVADAAIERIADDALRSGLARKTP